MKLTFLITLSLAIFLSACGTPQFSRGKFNDPNEINLLNDKFNEAHAQELSKQVVAQLLEKCPAIRSRTTPPMVAISGIKNRTEEMIDLKMVTNMISSSLVSTGKVRFIERELREEVESEYRYGEQGYVSDSTKKTRGHQVAPDYLLSGDLHTNVQEVGKDKLLYYYLSVKLVNTETTVMECAAERELRSDYRKRRE